MSAYYSDGTVTLHHGDCRKVSAWLAADVLVTDPPYGIGYESAWADPGYQKGRPVANDGTTDARDAALTMWGSHRPALVFGTWRAPRPSRRIRQVLVWDRGLSPSMGDLAIPWGPSHDEVYVLGEEWPAGPKGGRLRHGGNPHRGASVIRVNAYDPKHADRPDHPTPKPVALMERLISKCPPGVIADPFAGSGPTLVAARNLGRQAIGVELEERYCELIAQRLQQQPLFVGAPGDAS